MWCAQARRGSIIGKCALCCGARAMTFTKRVSSARVVSQNSTTALMPKPLRHTRNGKRARNRGRACVLTQVTDKKRPITREERARIDAQYGSKRWRDLRARLISAFPYCERCHDDNRVSPAEEIHHVIPSLDRPDLFYDETNLMRLCKRCHLEITHPEARRIPCTNDGRPTIGHGAP